MAKRSISRRNFIRNASCAAVGSTTLMNTLTNLKFMNSAAAINGFNDYKAMVVILLGGGNDSYNMLIPYDDIAHGVYSTTRTNLALPKFNTYTDPDTDQLVVEDLRPLNYPSANAQNYALHYNMPRMQGLFNENKLSFVSNIGTLVQPTTRQQIYDGNANLPLGLYSHSDQVMHWQTALPTERVAQGWGGKIADMFESCNENENISMNLSFAGNNVFQTGKNTVEFSLRPSYSSGDQGGATELEGISEEWQYPTAKRNTVNSMIDQY